MTPLQIQPALDVRGMGVEDLELLVMAFTLSAARHLAFMVSSPILNKQTMPRLVRLGFSLSLSILIAPASFVAFQADRNLVAFFLPLLGKELIVGFLLGMIIWMPIRGLELVGVIFDTQRGSGNAGDQDPLFGASTTPTAVLLQQIFAGYFFASGAFLALLLLLVQSTQIWPATAALPLPDQRMIAHFIDMAGALFFVGVVYAIPIAGFMLLADIVIAYLARSAPTLNALVFGMPIKSAIMLIMLVYYVDQAFPALVGHFRMSLEEVARMFSDER
ncbi:MAG: EscT/YscT/HrcT family type III secretion system export apparatus protein [Paracoccaceae bacterium]